VSGSSRPSPEWPGSWEQGWVAWLAGQVSQLGPSRGVHGQGQQAGPEKAARLSLESRPSGQFVVIRQTEVRLGRQTTDTGQYQAQWLPGRPVVDKTGRSSQEVSPWVRIRMNGVHGQAWSWLSWRPVLL